MSMTWFLFRINLKTRLCELFLYDSLKLRRMLFYGECGIKLEWEG